MPGNITRASKVHVLMPNDITRTSMASVLVPNKKAKYWQKMSESMFLYACSWAHISEKQANVSMFTIMGYRFGVRRDSQL